MYRNGQYTFQKLVTWSLPNKSLNFLPLPALKLASPSVEFQSSWASFCWKSRWVWYIGSWVYESLLGMLCKGRCSSFQINCIPFISFLVAQLFRNGQFANSILPYRTNICLVCHSSTFITRHILVFIQKKMAFGLDLALFQRSSNDCFRHFKKSH